MQTPKIETIIQIQGFYKNIFKGTTQQEALQSKRSFNFPIPIMESRMKQGTGNDPSNQTPHTQVNQTEHYITY